MIEQEVTDKTVEAPLPLVGSFLTAGREAAELSVDEFAKRLNLSAAQLTNLENNQFAPLGPATFVKGYIKSYCKFLSLDENYVLSLYEAQTEGPTISKMQSFSRRTEKEAHDNRLMLVSYAIVLLVIGLSALWWWQNRDLAPAHVTNGGEIHDIQEVGEIVETTSALDMTISNNEDVASDLTESTESSEQIAPQTQQPEKMLSEQALLEQALSEQAQSEQLSSEQQESSLGGDAVEANTENAAVSTIVPSAPLINEKPAQNGVTKIVMYFNNDSWVEIFDASAARIAFGVKKAGYPMTVEGKAPFSVVVGKPHVVDVEFDGVKIDMSKFPSHRIAKFNLPLTE